MIFTPYPTALVLILLIPFCLLRTWDGLLSRETTLGAADMVPAFPVSTARCQHCQLSLVFSFTPVSSLYFYFPLVDS